MKTELHYYYGHDKHLIQKQIAVLGPTRTLRARGIRTLPEITEGANGIGLGKAGKLAADPRDPPRLSIPQVPDVVTSSSFQVSHSQHMRLVQYFFSISRHFPTIVSPYSTSDT